MWLLCLKTQTTVRNRFDGFRQLSLNYLPSGASGGSLSVQGHDRHMKMALLSLPLPNGRCLLDGQLAPIAPTLSASMAPHDVTHRINLRT